MPSFDQHFVTANDGLILGFRIYSSSAASTALPVVCLPGLTRNARDFHQIAEAISNDPIQPRKVISVDYRGRGSSQRAADASTYTIPQETQDVLAVLDDLQIERALFIGTSRGGLITQILAQIALPRVAAIVFNDVGPKLGLEGLKQIQDYLQKPVHLRTWDDAVRHLKEIHAESFPVLRESDWVDLAQAVYRQGNLGIEADCDPAIGASFAAIPLDQPLPELWPQFDLLQDTPLLTVRGETSALLTAEILAEMSEHHRQMQIVIAAGQGHAPLLHLPQVREPLLAFLRGIAA